MYVQGVSTHKVKAITDKLCGHSFSASSISAINQRLDASLAHHEAEALATADQVDAQRRGGEKLPAR
jgi:transposase-like protein